MESYSDLVLNKLKDTDVLSSEDLNIPTHILHGVLLSLESKGQVVFELKEKKVRKLTLVGEEFVEKGSQEVNLFNAIPNEGASNSILEEYPLGSSYAFKNRWIKIDNERIYKAKEKVEDTVAEMLKRLDIATEKQFEDMKKRKLVEQSRINVYEIRKGVNYGVSQNYETELTSQMVENFQGQKFKPYNFNSLGTYPTAGAQHPLLRIREEFKKIFLEMGFKEMETNRYVESSFWNFDSLFQPQNHPSRDAHDTFFIKTPAKTTKFEESYFNRVKEVHQTGGFGSTGHQAVWSAEEAQKNVLRTHTTAISSRYLKALASDFKPCKFFSIDKVFRNESLDATHLAEFHQVEGVIAGHGVGLSDLMGFLKTFFEKLGLHSLKFKPAFNPYTEPSMEVFGYHTGLKKWIEIGNSGVFRPEMLRPMGLPEDVSVLGWGLSLERPAMIKYGLNNIRDLVGHKVDFNFIKKSEFIFF